MSKYSRVTTRFMNRIALKRALEAIFGAESVEDCEVAKQLYGYRGDLREERANLIVRRKHVGGSSNDLGWAWNEKTGVFESLVSEYDQGHARTRLEKLEQAYGVEVAKITAAEMGYNVLGVTIGEDGSVNLEIDIPEGQFAQTYV